MCSSTESPVGIKAVGHWEIKDPSTKLLTVKLRANQTGDYTLVGGYYLRRSDGTQGFIRTWLSTHYASEQFRLRAGEERTFVLRLTAFPCVSDSIRLQITVCRPSDGIRTTLARFYFE